MKIKVCQILILLLLDFSLCQKMVGDEKEETSKVSKKNYVINSTTDINGVILPKGEVVASLGENVTFEITPNIGYAIESVFVDDEKILVTNKYSFKNIFSAHKIHATFVPTKLLVLGRFNSVAVENIKSIVVGWQFISVLKTDGSIMSWYNNGSYTNSFKLPDDFSKDVSRIAAGQEHLLALKSDGKVLNWNFYRQELKVKTDFNHPIELAGGNDQTIVLQRNGRVKSWGSNSPVNLRGITGIASGYKHISYLLYDGTVVSWGVNSCEQISSPVGLNNVVAISAGEDFTIALKSDGSVITWGKKESIVLSTPKNLTGVVAIAAGARHAIVLKNDNSVIACGENNFGQTNIPSKMPPIQTIAAGGFTTVIVFK